MEAVKIERWISVIEDNDFITDKDKQIENLINLWKFSSCYGNDAQITDDGLLSIPSKNIGVTFADICLKASLKSDFIDTIASTISTMLDDRHNHAYYIELYRHNANFTSGTAQMLEEEITNAIQGRLTPYNHVKKITKIAASPGIYSNLCVKDCTRNDIYTAIQNATDKDDSNEWLVVVLDRLISHCDSFYIADDVLLRPFSTGYKKLFLFDFYKGEITQLAVTQ